MLVLLQIINNISFSDICIETLATKNDVLKHILCAMKEITDHLDTLLDILLRLIMKSKRFVKDASSGEMFDFLIEILKGTKGMKTKTRCSYILKYLVNADPRLS